MACLLYARLAGTLITSINGNAFLVDFVDFRKPGGAVQEYSVSSANLSARRDLGP